MGIVNVNMLQGNIDNTEYLTSYTHIYLKEALANLGQRTGIKGDGISQGMFKANELINNYTDISYDSKTALVIGSEGSGVSRLVSEKADFIISIPMKGKINSLNASVAAGIVIYEVVRQRK